MTGRVATIIVEPYLLVRDALDSLLEGHSYRVVSAVGSIPEIGGPEAAGNAIKLVILGEQTVDDAVTGSAHIRKLWPESKIVLLYESASPGDFQKLLASELDGCVPLLVSPDTLIKTLDVVVSGDARAMVMAGAYRPSIQLAKIEDVQLPLREEGNPRPISLEPEPLQIAPTIIPHSPITLNGNSPIAMNGTGPIAVNGTGQKAVNGNGHFAVNGSGHIGVTGNGHLKVNGNGHIGVNGNGVHLNDPGSTPSRRFPKLSEREAQILDCLVKGHANKVIARTFEITEATVKVHMKSILRKIQVANRTQAAIWALEHGYSPDEIEDRLLDAAEA